MGSTNICQSVSFIAHRIFYLLFNINYIFTAFIGRKAAQINGGNFMMKRQGDIIIIMHTQNKLNGGSQKIVIL